MFKNVPTTGTVHKSIHKKVTGADISIVALFILGYSLKYVFW